MELFTKKYTENIEQRFVGELDRLCIHTKLLLSSIQLRMKQLRSKSGAE